MSALPGSLGNDCMSQFHPPMCRRMCMCGGRIGGGRSREGGGEGKREK